MSTTQAPRRDKLLGFVYYERSDDDRWRLHFRWARIFSLFAVLIAIGWLSSGLFLYLFFKYKRNYDEASYVKMLILPLRYEEHRKEMGDYHIEKAKELLEEGEYSSALTFLRAGVMRSSANVEGRMILADFYLSGYRRPELAIELLRQGAPYGYQNMDYIRGTVRLMLQQQEDIQLLELADEFLPKLEKTEDAARLLALGAASAAFYRGMYDHAETLIEEFDLEQSPEGIILKSKILNARGQTENAIVLLESNTGRFASRELLYMELIRTYREAENFDKARRYAILRNLNNPLNPGPRIELLHAYAYSDQKDRLDIEIDNFIDQFGTEQNSLALLAEFGAKTGNPELNRRVYNLAIQNNLDLSLFSFLVIEAENNAGNYREALDLIDQITEENPAWLDNKTAIFSALRAVAYFGDGQDAKGGIYLRDILQSPNVRVQTLLAVSRNLKKLGQLEEARSLFLAAYEESPENQGALTELMRLDIELGRIDDLKEKLENLLSMRRPPYDLLQIAYERLGSDKFIYTPNRNNVMQQLDQILRERQTS